MKKLLLFSLLLSFSQYTSAKLVQESYVIPRYTQETFDLLKSRPELTIDHVHDRSFEIHGPKGLGEFLNRNNIYFTQEFHEHGFAKDSYPSPEEIADELHSLVKSYPHISKIFSIGKSVQGRDLWVVKISNNPEINNGKPEFKYIANMHGNEIVGREVSVSFIKDLLMSYGQDEQITNLVDNLQIYIMPSMNPDGANRGTRGNAKGIDLNRDFPDFSTKDNKETYEGRQPETQAIMKWQKERRFVLSANFHGGAEVVSYPWDAIATKHPLDELIKDLSLEYANLSTYMKASTVFKNGITNGFRWYKLNGGMQDWSIHYHNDLQITIELSTNKWPHYSKNEYYYLQNKPAMLRYMERALTL